MHSAIINNYDFSLAHPMPKTIIPESTFHQETLLLQNQNKWLPATRQAAAESTDERLAQRQQGRSVAGQEPDRLRGRVVADFHVRRATPGRLTAATAAAQSLRERLPAESEDAHPHHHQGDGAAAAATTAATATKAAAAGKSDWPVQSGRAAHAQGFWRAAQVLFVGQIHQTPRNVRWRLGVASQGDGRQFAQQSSAKFTPWS